jgi:ketosteroid isomerase-like protein
MRTDLPPFLSRLLEATNRHDLDALVDCFEPDYRNETPVHPGRGFQGNEQVRANWRQIFTFVPDVRADVLRWAEHGADLWSEWEMTGTRPDGSAHHMRGVLLFRLSGTRAASARLYLEPVDENDSTNVDGAVAAQVRATSAP